MVYGGDLGDSVLDAPQLPENRPIPLVKPFKGRGRDAPQLFGAGKYLAALFQLFFLAGSKRCTGNLVRLIRQEIQFPFSLPLHFVQAREAFLKGAETFEEPAELLPLPAQAGIGVQEPQMVFRPKQGLGLMLAIDIDQAGGSVGKERQGGHAPVDEDPVFPGP